MFDKHYFTLPTEHFTIEGRSRAGHETWFRIRELGIALDIGRCPDVLLPLDHVFVSHAHLDHSVGIPFYAGQRHLQRMGEGRVYVPAAAANDFRELMRIHERLEGTGYNIAIVGLAAGDEVQLSRTHSVRTHDATHRVPANAYEVVEHRHHLKKEFVGLHPNELAGMRQRGVQVSESSDYSLLFYTGDTDRGILEQSEQLFRAEVLMIECSFIGDGDYERATKYRHIHFDDLIDFADRFENKLIVLTHFSRRYSASQVRDELRRRCPTVLRDRLRLTFPEPNQLL